jgi:HAD superfamily hydrolase (TIGR01484 family)
MGRPYAEELLEVDRTYNWCLSAKISDLARSVGKSATRPLIAVGSGGSLTAAHFVSLLHTLFTGQACQVFTPSEIVTTKQRITDWSVLICSAGGSNPDVLAAASAGIRRAPHHLFALITRAKSPLESQLKKANWPKCHHFSTPTRKDGFLATNSLLATILLLVRAYETWLGTQSCLPPTLSDLVHPDVSREEFLNRFRQEVTPVVARDTLIVLYGSWTKPAAMDVESRLTESGLASVQPADYRNFAHGRHYWLARHASNSAVLAFTEKETEMTSRTLAIIPPSIPRAQIHLLPGVTGAFQAVCHSLFLAAIAGGEKRVDPGRPRVPQFGRKLYYLRAAPNLNTTKTSERMALAIEKKTRLPITAVRLRPGLFEQWKAYYEAFVIRLSKAKLKAIVLDYDGTLCSPDRRFQGPSKETATLLNELLAEGVTIGVATGRGKSVRKDLGRVIRSKYREEVLVGYHNGAEIAPLSDISCPGELRSLAAELTSLANCLRERSSISRQARVEAKGKQITLELLPTGDPLALLSEVTREVKGGEYGAVSIVTSSHSIDVLASGVSKRSVIAALARRLGVDDGGASNILCIGDRGCFPGNDADLLLHPMALSVDEVSANPETCWNLSKPDLRFESACQEYLSRVIVRKSGVRFDVRGMLP